MVQHLFSQFLHDPTAYKEAVAYWHDLWTQAVPNSDWSIGYCTNRSPTGVEFRDGNPIFCVVSADKRKAVRVIQHEPTRNSPEIVFWWNAASLQASHQTCELVISCALSRESAYKATQLIRAWASGDVDLRRDPSQAELVISHLDAAQAA